MITIEFSKLEGLHVLDAVDYIHDGDANGIRFRLDGVVYTATEDPEDGYRSSMEDFIIGDQCVQNIFPAVLVSCKVHGSQYSDDILECTDVETGKTVLEVGTDWTDDYYPCFVSEFNPENMVTNQKIQEM